MQPANRESPDDRIAIAVDALRLAIAEHDARYDALARELTRSGARDLEAARILRLSTIRGAIPVVAAARRLLAEHDCAAFNEAATRA